MEVPSWVVKKAFDVAKKKNQISMEMSYELRQAHFSIKRMYNAFGCDFVKFIRRN